MRVAIINTVIGTGSVGRIACGTADEIINNGGSALLCRGRGEAIEGYENYRIGSDLDMFLQDKSYKKVDLVHLDNIL